MEIIFLFHKFLYFERLSRFYDPGNLRSHSFSAKKRSFFGIFVRGGIEFTVFRKLGLFFSCKIHLIAFRKLSRKNICCYAFLHFISQPSSAKKQIWFFCQKFRFFAQKLQIYDIWNLDLKLFVPKNQISSVVYAGRLRFCFLEKIRFLFFLKKMFFFFPISSNTA